MGVHSKPEGMPSQGTNRGWFYVCVPEIPPRADAIFELRAADIPEVEQGMILIKTIATAIAPHTRAFLELPGNDVGAEAIGLTRTKIGEPVPCELVGEVILSRSPKYSVGDRVACFAPLFEYCALRDDGPNPPAKLPSFVETEKALVMGAGLTAHIVINHHPCGRVDDPCCSTGISGCLSFLKRQPQKTVLVTSAAGAVGSMAGQIYKHKGCKVIGVTSTRKKAEQLVGLGFDATIAYKEEDLDKRLTELAPEGLDVFFDNVGAEQLDVGSKHMKVGGRIVQVGCAAEIDNYATGDIRGWKEYHRMAARELQVGGFLLTNHLSKIPGAMLSLMTMMARGKLKTAETIVSGDLDKWAECVDRLHSGDCFGRIVLTLDEKS
eukprot:TRINITY_DN40974_c0_g1_i1.p1 TRINITY_DN40974_c0_g1~~TRINITY_DN40974_c0_g1_i1.p1  ORF type:complete len:379 (+),score=86.88 TRINITY_DN40974_c0_g1_i1:57-1193(+)